MKEQRITIEIDEDGSVWDCPGHGAHVARVGDVTDADIRKAAAHAVNRLPVYIEAAAEMERRIESVNAECIRLSRKLAATAIGDSDVAHADGFYEGLLWALRKMRDGQ